MKKQGGRKKVTNPRSHRWTFRFTQEEKNQILLAASQSGMPVHTYCRELLIAKTNSPNLTHRRVIIDSIREVALQLAPIGNNINQLAKSVNLAYKAKTNINTDQYNDFVIMTTQILELKKKLHTQITKLRKS